MIKEPEKKEKINHIFGGLGREYLLIVLLFAAAVAGGLIFHFYLGKDQDKITDFAESGNIKVSEESTSSASSASSTSSQSESSVASSAKTADQFYQSGLEEMNAQSYQKAVDQFAEGIKIDPKQPLYYSRKAQAEYNLGQKEQAIKTLQEGLAENPGNDLLTSRLDVLEKDWYGNQPQ